MDYIYLRSKKEDIKIIVKDTERCITRVRKIGLIGIDMNSNQYYILGSFCSPKDNFSKLAALDVADNYDRHRVIPDSEILMKVTFTGLMKSFGFMSSAIKQNLDFERAEVSFNKLKERVINDTNIDDTQEGKTTAHFECLIDMNNSKIVS